MDIERIDTWPTCILSINEQLLLMAYVAGRKIQKQDQHCLRVLSYLKRCMDAFQVPTNRERAYEAEDDLTV